jgi:hypothetical protein
MGYYNSDDDYDEVSDYEIQFDDDSHTSIMGFWVEDHAQGMFDELDELDRD